MRCVLGIGNPGREYDGTRHNLGFTVLDALARRHALGSWRRDWQAQVCEWRLPERMQRDGCERALLLKPSTYVNLSGTSAQAALAFFKIPPSELLVVVDDLALPLGSLRLRPDGSAGGHNGLKDIEAKLGRQYPRLRLGMGPLPPGADQVGFVLGGFAPEQRAVADAMIARAADCVEGWLADGVQIACRFNGPAVEPAPVKVPPKSNAPPVSGPAPSSG